MTAYSHHSADESCDGKPDVSAKGGSSADHHEMQRMGKAQELRRNFRFLPILGFVSLLQATWEGALLSNYPGLMNGGTGGVIWCTIAVWLLMTATIASLAEMASMAPTAGGYEFAPRSLQCSLSYIVGWCCCLGWIAGVPSLCMQLSGLIQAMVLVVYPDANVDSLWQMTLMVFAFIILTVCFNIFFAQHLPLAEGLILFLHIFAFFAILLTLWIMPEKHAPAPQVFGSFYNGGGWSNMGLSCLVGLTTPIWCFIGPDAGAHMSEELKDASVQLPRAMLWAIVGNGVLGVVMLITFCFCITDLQSQVIDATTDYPIVNILYAATKSKAGTCVLGSTLVILLFFSTVTTVASASRQIWAFSRDRGLPFSSKIRYVPPTWEIPVNALLICLGVSIVLSVINFGSNTAFNAVTSVSNAALIFSYIISIGCMRLKRLRGQPLLHARFSLGKWGGLVNDISLGWLIIGFIFAFFPSAPYTSEGNWWKESANYSLFMFLLVCLIAAVYYVLLGKRQYVAPVLLVKDE
ncbi:amino acid transporter [Piedraia hortae CBS 480.64]|uniref:Amino acid transporter n=1 Tax=Piedraia hortae CBS 480.64 TaxID=1314780 RepID=A0A6A7BVR3_9PEZI|nr:amino acid transporter [Piedraia hortae CBS 480.64]